MAVTETWTDPDSLDRAAGDVLTEVIYDGLVSDLAYLGGQTATGVVDSKRIGLPVDNSTGGTLTAGTLVYISGYDASTGAPQVTKADGDSHFAEYVLSADIANAAAGVVYRGYTLGSQDTSGESIGDPIYLSATAGGWTATALTGAAQVSQKVGVVVTSHASTGQVQIDLPGELLRIGSGNLQSKSVAVSALADGTDGELVTWDASGEAATVGVGTATHVLTSNGAGAAPTFQAAAGGGMVQQTTQNLGLTVGTTTSTTYVDIPSSDGQVTLTTTGGDLLVWYAASIRSDTDNQYSYCAIELDGGSEVAITRLRTADANVCGTYTTYHRFGSVAAGSHTVSMRWRVAGNTSTMEAYGGIVMQEIS